MGLNRALVGKRYAQTRVVLDAARVRLFSTSIGHEGDGVPPTLVTAPEIAAGLSNVVADRELGLDLSRVLHGEQEYEWSRPLRVGEELTATSTIEDIRGRPALEFLVVRTEMTDATGDPVCVGRSTLIVRGGS
jgi:hypothetical protein